MRLRFFHIPVFDSAAAETELNQFLASHRVLAVERQLVSDGSRSSWAVCVSYTEAPAPSAAELNGKRERVDYKEILAPEEFALFAKLRELRKTVAEREGVPPYAVFTNEQLAEMVRRKVRSQSQLAAIDGVGPARIDKHGKLFVDVLRAQSDAVVAEREA